MARKKAELLQEMVDNGLSYDISMTKAQLMNSLRDHYYFQKNDSFIMLPQISPMLCKDAKDYLDYSLEKPWESQRMKSFFWDNPNWIVEQKLDGARMKFHITEDGIRLDSRRISDADYMYKERTANFPHFSQFSVEKLKPFIGSVFDGEIFMPVKSINTGAVVTDGYLNSTVAVTNSSPEVSRKIQQNYQPCIFYIFDVCNLYKKYAYRLKFIRDFYSHVSQTEIGEYIKMPLFAVDNKQQFFERMISEDEEGIIFKHSGGLYEQGKRSIYQYKLKKFHTADCFITGFIPGCNSNEGMVGSLVVSVMKDREIVEIGAVSGFTDKLRRDISYPSSGRLKSEYYGRVVSVRYQELTKTKRLRHATLFRWRPDKGVKDCVGDDLK